MSSHAVDATAARRCCQTWASGVPKAPGNAALLCRCPTRVGHESDRSVPDRTGSRPYRPAGPRGGDADLARPDTTKSGYWDGPAAGLNTTGIRDGLAALLRSTGIRHAPLLTPLDAAWVSYPFFARLDPAWGAHLRTTHTGNRCKKRSGCGALQLCSDGVGARYRARHSRD